MVQSLVVGLSDLVNVCLEGSPDMRGADDFDRDTKSGEPSEELGAHCDIDVGKKVMIIHRHDHDVLAEAVNDDADKFIAAP